MTLSSSKELVEAVQLAIQRGTPMEWAIKVGIDNGRLLAAEQMREAAAKLVEEAGCSCDGIVHYDDCPKYSIALAIRSIIIQ